jgi:pSer/pThr/pTyr-binding forkhead associated (FHA) protein
LGKSKSASGGRGVSSQRTDRMPGGAIPKVPIRLVIEGEEATYDLLNKPFHIGRDPENDLVIDDPFVSLKHLVLDPSEHGWVARDLGSSNGTVLLSPKGGDGGKLGETTLRPGWGLRLGKTILWLRPLPLPAVKPNR